MAVPSADHLVGIIRTDLDNLDFLPLRSNEPSRLEKSQDVLRLLRIFSETGWERTRDDRVSEANFIITQHVPR